MEYEEDLFENYKKRQLEIHDEKLANNSTLIQEFIGFCQQKNIILTDDNFDYIPAIGIVAKFPNLLNLLNQIIKPDKEGLVEINLLDQLFKKQLFVSGYYYSEKYMVMAHPFFRRGYHENGNFAPLFIDNFWKYDKKGNSVYLALDFDRVRINVDGSIYMELDTWYGAKFKNTISDIEDGIVKLRPPLNLEPFDIEFFFGNTYSLDIKWSTNNGIKVFYVEEFKADNSKILKDGREFHPVRYLHAEFDSQLGMFRHFDGAIHFYTEDEYFLRRDSDFNYHQKSNFQLKAKAQKLFKINGELEIKDWVNLTSHFLTGDPLIFEYFEGKLPDRLIDTVDKLTKHRTIHST
jgi:hypothetical protein